MTRVERLEKALELAMAAVNDAKVNDKVGWRRWEKVASEIYSVLTPPAAYEDVEVVSYMGLNAQGNQIYHGDAPPETWSPDFPLVKLTCTYQRPKPQPVEKTVTACVLSRSVMNANNTMLLEIPKIDGHPAAGTVVTLTWEEDQ